MSLWTQLVCESAYVANPASLGAACGAGNDLEALTEQPRPRRSDAASARIVRPPNGSRLSCGRNARGRKAAERQIKGSPARQRNSSLLVSARQLQALVRRRPA